MEYEEGALGCFLSVALVFGQLPMHALAESARDYPAELSDEQIAQIKESGELEITDNGTVYDADDESLMIQGKKNINKSEWHWWGLKKWHSDKKAKKAAYRFWEWGFGAATAGSAAALLSAPLSLALIATGAQDQLVTHDITQHNKKKRGVILRLTWLYYYTVKTQ